MKKFLKSLLALACVCAMLVPVLAACDDKDKPIKEVDYAGELKLDMASETKKQEVTVRLQIDGDTTHFDPVKNSTVTPNANPADFDKTDGYIKARYIAINTPESTGKIEKWGKTASIFTKGKLATAESIVVESDDANWNIDSTGERYVLWVWYKAPGAADYRNLNIEILQNGYAWGSSTVNNRYGEIAGNALMQAQNLKLHVFSPATTVDENYFGTSEAATISLKELRCHFDEYIDKPVVVEGNVISVYDDNAYIEEYDEETETYFGVQVYMSFTLGTLRNILKAGNRVRVYGTATEGTFGKQITSVQYDDYEPDSPKNTIILGEAGSASAAWTEIEPKDIATERKVQFKFEDEEAEGGFETVELAYRDAIFNTSVCLKNLTVKSVYTTTKEGDSQGAMTITCVGTNKDGSTSEVSIRTEVLKDEDGNRLTAALFPKDSVIPEVKGIIGLYTSDSGVTSYQVNVPFASLITLPS